MRTASAALKELELLHHLPAVTRESNRQITHPALMDVEDNLIRLLGAGLALMARTSFFLDKSVPYITYPRFSEATVELEAHNRALFLDPTVTDAMTILVKRNMPRISQISVIGRVGLHLERLDLLVSNAVEREWIINCLGPSADSIFLLGTRAMNLLRETDSTKPLRAEESLHWELLMVQGSLQAAREEFNRTGVLSRGGRRYVRATLWSFQVAQDALMALCRS